MRCQSCSLLLFLTYTFLTQIAIGRTHRSQNYRPNKQPHIILMMADDLGWNDVSFHGSDQIPTSNIDALAFNGVILNNHYSQALCTPSRSALLTGRYPIHTGMQHNVILSSEPWGLPLRERLLSQELKSLGYSTHIVGKWHLGFYRKEYTPTFRGFDSHYGFWTGYHDYFNHQAQDTSLVEYFIRRVWPDLKFQPFEGLDMRRGLEVDTRSTGQYSTDLFTDEAAQIIKEHGSACGWNCQKPLFLYVAYSAPHAGNYEDPLQAPEEALDRFRFIKNEERRKYAAMVWKLDESVGRIVSALEESSMLDDSIIVFLSDNGAQTNGLHYNRGSNFPLKGEKISPWEGGVRTVAFVWSPRIKNPGRVSNQLMHITDWMPTLLSAAGSQLSAFNLPGGLPLDGVDMGPDIFEGPPASARPPPHWYDARNEVLINIDDSSKYAAIRIGDYKLIDEKCIRYINCINDTAERGVALIEEYNRLPTQGEQQKQYLLQVVSDHRRRYPDFAKGALATNRTTLLGFQDHWVGDSGRGNRNIPPYNASSVIHSRAAKAVRPRTSKSLSAFDMESIRSSAVIKCDALWPPKDLDLPAIFPPCAPLFKPCLFDVAHDPCEKRNLYNVLPDFVKSLRTRLEELRATAAAPNNKASEYSANPKYWNDTWTNWRDFPKPKNDLLGYKFPFFG